MRGMLWRLNTKDTMDKGVDDAVRYFRKKHGYAPRLLLGRQEELNFLHVRTDLDVRAGTVQRGHVVLYEVAQGRTPVICRMKRIPVL